MKPRSLRQIGWSFGLITSLGCEVSQPARGTVWVTIPPNATLESVAESLATHGIVRSARSFRWYVQWSGARDALKAGVYEFPEALPIAQVAATLRKGVAPLDTVVIPPGITLAEAAPIFERELGIDSNAFMRAASSALLRERLGARGSTVEGYLLPGTHAVRVGSSAAEVLTVVTDAFASAWSSAWRDQLDSIGLDRHEVVTLASIVEGEVRHDEERPIVSSVYHNRLAMGMRLQADPTIIYALQERRRLFNSDYEIDSPFNTYRYDGLPPHPINQPSTASIEAALYPDNTNYLYFVAGPDGRHHFSSRYDEHLAAIRRLRGNS
jgi:UPF0755 protein